MGWGRSASAAGIVIRSREVELLALKGKMVASRVRVPIQGTEPADLVQALQRAVAEAGVPAARVPVAIPSQEVLFRFFTIPSVPKQECDAVVQFEARKYIPFKTELLIWDYRAVPALDGRRLEVIFAAIPRDVYKLIHEALAAAGIQPTLVEPRSLSLARLAQSVKGAPANEFICLVDVEQDAAHLAIVKNRLPYLTRDIEFAPAEGPEGAAPAGPPALADAGGAADPRAQRLLSELSVSMDFFLREHPSTAVSRALLFGDESLVGPWCGWLSDQLHRPVALGHELLAGRVDGELPLSFASAVGLLRAASEPASTTLDFLRRSQAKPAGAPKAERRAHLLAEALTWIRSPQAIAGACLLGGLLLAAWGGSRMLMSAERQRLDQVLRSAPAMGWGLNDMSQVDLVALNDRAWSRLQLLKRLAQERVRVAAKLDVLARSLPDGVWVTSLEFEDRLTQAAKSNPSLVISGSCYLGDTTRELMAIQDLERRIKESKVFAAGFARLQLERILEQADPATSKNYRSFQMQCSGTGRS